MSTLKEIVEEVERQRILDALKTCNWIMTRAARQLGITQWIIGYKIKKYGLTKVVEYRRGEMS